MRYLPQTEATVAEMLDVAPERLRAQLLADVAPAVPVSEEGVEVEEAA